MGSHLDDAISVCSYRQPAYRIDLGDIVALAKSQASKASPPAVIIHRHDSTYLISGYRHYRPRVLKFRRARRRAASVVMADKIALAAAGGNRARPLSRPWPRRKRNTADRPERQSRIFSSRNTSGNHKWESDISMKSLMKKMKKKRRGGESDSRYKAELVKREPDNHPSMSQAPAC